jgi:hypothetical protein
MVAWWLPATLWLMKSLATASQHLHTTQSNTAATRPPSTTFTFAFYKPVPRKEPPAHLPNSRLLHPRYRYRRWDLSPSSLPRHQQVRQHHTHARACPPPPATSSHLARGTQRTHRRPHSIATFLPPPLLPPWTVASPKLPHHPTTHHQSWTRARTTSSTQSPCSSTS